MVLLMLGSADSSSPGWLYEMIIIIVTILLYCKLQHDIYDIYGKRIWYCRGIKCRMGNVDHLFGTLDM